jgi:hypothetical protein
MIQIDVSLSPSKQDVVPDNTEQQETFVPNISLMRKKKNYQVKQHVISHRQNE